MATNIIAINRGDTFEFSVTIADASSETGIYTLRDNDAIYFGLMDPNQQFENALVKKKIGLDSEYVDPEGNISIVIEPEDTIDLLPGRYFYMIKLKMDHVDDQGDEVHAVKTIIDKTKFVIYD